MTTAQQGLDVINERFGVHPRHRALHAKGVHCKAEFRANERGAELSRAAHMSGEAIPTFVRLSNGGGDPTVPDYEPDVRGLAVSFQLPDGARTDILCQTLERFPFKDQEGFFDSVRASDRSLAGLARIPGLLLRSPKAIRALPGSLKTMGRAPRADFVVDAALVSRVHCRFTLDHANALELEDLGSTNGTFLNGKKVSRATLSDGDQLTIGRVQFVVNSDANDPGGNPKTTWSV